MAHGVDVISKQIFASPTRKATEASTSCTKFWVLIFCYRFQLMTWGSLAMFAHIVIGISTSHCFHWPGWRAFIFGGIGGNSTVNANPVVPTTPVRVATNLENLEYSGIYLNMEYLWNSQGILFSYRENWICALGAVCVKQSICMQPSVFGARKLLIWAGSC